MKLDNDSFINYVGHLNNMPFPQVENKILRFFDIFQLFRNGKKSALSESVFG